MPIPASPRAVVTGAAAGLGRELCLALAKRGAKIIVSDRDLAGAQETARLVRQAGGSAHAVACDVSKREEVEQLACLAEQCFGGTDLLINNAGVLVSGTVGEIPLREWEWIMNINLWGVIYGCHVFAPRLQAQGSGHILNVASAAGLLCLPGMGPYNVTKAAVIALSETLRGELQRHGVGVTALCPTFFQTNILRSGHSHMPDSNLELEAAQRSQQSKLQAADIARIALAACERNELYAVPMSDGRWSWRLKRLTPEGFFNLMPRALQYAEARRKKSRVS